MARAYALCERRAREHYENFPVASRLLPAAMRPHIAAIYAFARTADDYADEPASPPTSGLRLLDAWGAQLAAAASGQAVNRAPAFTIHRLTPGPFTIHCLTPA